MEDLRGSGEVLQRTPEKQAIIDRSIDLVAEQSVAHGPNSVMLESGLKQAALLLVGEVDGTPYGFDRLATFYADRAAADPVFAHGQLTFAARIAEEFPVSVEVAERLVAACIRQGSSHAAVNVAQKRIGRNLTEEEVLGLAIRSTSDHATYGSDDRERHVKIAAENGASPEVVAEINRLFDDKDRVWANSFD